VFDPGRPDFFDPVAAEKELARVTEICDGCRRCHRLCTTFDFMLDTVDAHEGDLAKITSNDYRRMVDLCWQCKLCFNHCPYTPPHRWAIDFPRLLLRAKAARASVEGVTRQDRWLGEIDTVGAVGAMGAPLSNWANDFKPWRTVMEKTVGVHRDRNLPKFHRQTFNRWFAKRGPRVEEGHPVALFSTCLVNYNEPQVGRDTVGVLEKNACRVTCPDKQVCCGMPYLDGGDIKGAQENARRNVALLAPLVEQGADVVVPQPTCSYMLKKEYPLLVPGEATDRVAARTKDLFEFLADRHREGRLSTEFTGKAPGKVAYQMPCHLRAQNMGYKTRDVLQLIPGTRVTTVERCTAMDGTWGMKTEYYPISVQFATKTVDQMKAAEADVFMSDCSLAALQIEHIGKRRVAHPASLLREAYGLPEER
jgi:glycerol-3-phosphate dehydrogenase subunit C